MSSSGNLFESGSAADLNESDLELTPAEVLRELQQAWQNEQFSPELLPHRFEIVDCVIDQLNAMEQNLNRSQSKNSIRNSMHKMEIEKYVFFCLEEDKNRKNNSLEAKMSTEETRFALEFQTAVSRHIDDSVMAKLPSKVQGLDYKKIGPQPNLMDYVFLKVNTEVQDPTDSNFDSESNWEPDSQHLGSIHKNTSPHNSLGSNCLNI